MICISEEYVSESETTFTVSISDDDHIHEEDSETDEQVSVGIPDDTKKKIIEYYSKYCTFKVYLNHVLLIVIF